MTETIDTYIKELVMDDMVYIGYDNFESDLDGQIQHRFNDYDDAFTHYGPPTLDEFMSVQHACYDYLEGCDSLDSITEEKRDWKWWFNIYAMSMEWMGDNDKFKEYCFENQYEDAIINFQSNIRRRLATIKVIKKLHLTGSM